MGLLEGSPWPKIAAICLVLAFLSYLVAFGAPNWAETNPKTVTRREYIGLWRYCVSAEGGYQACDDFININTSGMWSIIRRKKYFFPGTAPCALRIASAEVHMRIQNFGQEGGQTKIKLAQGSETAQQC